MRAYESVALSFVGLVMCDLPGVWRNTERLLKNYNALCYGTIQVLRNAIRVGCYECASSNVNSVTRGGRQISKKPLRTTLIALMVAPVRYVADQ